MTLHSLNICVAAVWASQESVAAAKELLRDVPGGECDRERLLVAERALSEVAQNLLRYRHLGRVSE